MNTIKIMGKFLDQPILIERFKKTVPYLLVGGGSFYTYNQIKNKDNKTKAFLKNGLPMATTIGTALLAPKITNKMFKISTRSLAKVKKENTELIDNFFKKGDVNAKTKSILEKSKTKILSFKEIKYLDKNLKTELERDLLSKLIPEPENVTSKEIFSEIGRLSILGFLPVLGGILGGILGDKLTNKNWREKVPDKIKEGSYQYLANIFLCNVGAGVALALLEKKNIKSKSQRALGMVSGIVTTGVLGGSVLANMLGNKLINPIFGIKNHEKSIYTERKPEALDIGLHIDDIATVAVMSGLKWIEPALPVMYSISGYRSGIGYRNGATKIKNQRECKDM